jgi:transcriptional regulator with XRE-family HTH domain
MTGITGNIRKLRASRHWSQEELALAAGVDVRTAQRAEAGKPLAVESLKAIAAAFDTTIEALQISDEMIAAAIEEFRKNCTIIDMRVSTGSADIGELLNSAEALLLQRIGDLSELQLDRFAEFEEMLRDYLDIWRDIPAASRREGEKTLQELLDGLKTADVSVSFGMERMRAALWRSLADANGGPLRRRSAGLDADACARTRKEHAGQLRLMLRRNWCWY